MVWRSDRARDAQRRSGASCKVSAPPTSAQAANAADDSTPFQGEGVQLCRRAEREQLFLAAISEALR
jgi:hypothetical protein